MVPSVAQTWSSPTSESTEQPSISLMAFRPPIHFLCIYYSHQSQYRKKKCFSVTHFSITSEVRRLCPVESSISAPILPKRIASCLKGFKILSGHREAAGGEGRQSAEGMQQQTENTSQDHTRDCDSGLRQHAPIPSHSQPRWSRQPMLGRTHQKPGSLCKSVCQDQGLELMGKKRVLILCAR